MSPNTVVTAWIKDGRLHPPAAYHRNLVGLGGLRALVHGTNRLRSSWNPLLLIALPTVHASAAAAADESVVTSSSSQIDHLVELREKIVVTEEDVLAVLENETGRDRLQVLFSKDVKNDFSYQLKEVGFTSVAVGLFFFAFMSVCGGNAAIARFLEKDKSRIHDTKFLAHRSFHDAYNYGAIKVGQQYAVKSGLFTFCFLMTAKSIAVYRNKTSMFEYIYAGALTCGLLRANLGLRGWISGTVIGSVIGVVYGAIACGLMYSAKVTQQDQHYNEIYENIREKREMQLLREMTSENAKSDEASIEDTAPAAKPTEHETNQ